jgi:hypothetical protein
MSVGSWEPAAATAELTADAVERLCAAARQLEVPDFGLDDEAIAALAPCARDGGAGSTIDWAATAQALDSERVVALIRLFTRAEMMFPAWKGGDRSPVIALATVLKRRGEFPAGLTTWIRANSDNRFLPYGSLLHRL